VAEIQRLRASATRPLRFAATGGVAAALQIAILTFLTRHGWEPLPANAAAFFLAAQANFALSSALTWRDRFRRYALAQRWVMFHLAIASTAVLNLVTFELVRTLLPTPAAALTGIAVAGFANFLLGDRVVFHARPWRAEFTSSGLVFERSSMPFPSEPQ
jgi:putative flippase GtrA